MNILPFFIICPLTFLAGLVDSIGGGGGLISLPAFMLAGLPAHTAIATNKLSSSIGTTVSTVRYCKHGFYDKALALPGIVAALIGSFCGARLLLHTSDTFLRHMMIVVLPVVAAVVLIGKKEPQYDASFPVQKRLAIVCASAFVIGLYDGFYGPGTGTFLLLALTHFAYMDVQTASGNVKLINLASNISALATFLFGGHIHYVYGLAGALFCLTGHYIGAGLVMKNGGRIVRPIVLAVLLLLFIKIISGN